MVGSRQLLALMVVATLCSCVTSVTSAATTTPDAPVAATTPAVTPPAATTPAATMPAATTPAATTPAATTPAATTPAATTPDATTPDATTPAATTPDATTPDATTPAATTPAATTPDATTPAATTPAVTPPAATTPAATTPAATAPPAISVCNNSPLMMVLYDPQNKMFSTMMGVAVPSMKSTFITSALVQMYPSVKYDLAASIASATSATSMIDVRQKTQTSSGAATTCGLLVTLDTFSDDVQIWTFQWTATLSTDTKSCSDQIVGLANTAAVAPLAGTTPNSHQTLLKVCCVATPTTRCNDIGSTAVAALWYGLPGGPVASTMPTSMKGAGGAVANSIDGQAPAADGGVSVTGAGGGSSDSSASSAGQVSTGAIAGIAVGAVAGVAAIVAMTVLILKKRSAARIGPAAGRMDV